jgi:hypothetical protein
MELASSVSIAFSETILGHLTRAGVCAKHGARMG